MKNENILIGAGILALLVLSAKRGNAAPAEAAPAEAAPISPLSTLSAGYVSGINGITGTTPAGDFAQIMGAGNFNITNAKTNNTLYFFRDGMPAGLVPGRDPHQNQTDIHFYVNEFATGRRTYFATSEDVLNSFSEFEGMI